MDTRAALRKAFNDNLRRRIRQNLVLDHPSDENPRRPGPQPGRRSGTYDYLFTKQNRANILNVVGLISDEITPNMDVVLIPEISMQNAQFLGQGATMEVLAAALQLSPEQPPTRVAIKRISRQYSPIRNKRIPLENDFIYLQKRRTLYTKVEDMLQEIRVLARVSCYSDGCDIWPPLLTLFSSIATVLQA